MLGELGIVQTALSPDTWRAGKEGAIVYAVDRRTMHSLLHGAAGRRRQRAANALQELPMLEGLTKGQLYALVDVMRRAEVPANSGMNDAFLHILLRGAVRLSDRGALHRAACAEDEPAGPLAGPVVARVGDAFGEAACLANGANPLGIVVTAVTDAEVMFCDRDTFARVLGEPEALLLPGAQRKVALPRPSTKRDARAPDAPSAGAGYAAMAADTIAEDDEEEEAAVHTATPDEAVPMALEPTRVSATAMAMDGVSASDDALVEATSTTPSSGSSSRFRTPNQEVTWHGSSAVRAPPPALRVCMPCPRKMPWRVLMRFRACPFARLFR